MVLRSAIISLTISMLLVIQLQAQKYITEESKITFFSEAPLEDIDATNTKATSLFDREKGDIVVSIPIKDFEFEKSLMKEHFNEKYLESDQFPKATFNGKILNYQNENGKRNASAEGKISIHGVTKPITIEGTLEMTDNQISIEATFPITVDDFKISIPKLLFHNIAEVVEVKVQFTYKPYEK